MMLVVTGCFSSGYEKLFPSQVSIVPAPNHVVIPTVTPDDKYRWKELD